MQRVSSSGGAMGSQVQTEAPLPAGGPHSVPAIVLDHVSELDDVLAFLVLLAGLKGVLIFPAQSRLAALTVDIGHSM